MRFVFLLIAMVVASCKTDSKGNGDYLIKDGVMYVSPSGDSIKYRTVVWGLAGGHERTAIFSINRPLDEIDCNVSNEICILGEAPIFYSAYTDTVTVYSEVLSDTVRRIGDIVVKQVKISTMTRITYENNYENLGLSLIGKIPNKYPVSN